MAIHKVKTEDKEYTLNFKSYAVMMLYRKFTPEEVKNISINELNYNMIKWGLSDNGRQEVSDPDVYDFIDEIGGAASKMYLETIFGWIVAALTDPNAEEESKKKELEAV